MGPVPDSRQTALLEVRNLTTVFWGRRRSQNVAVDDVSFSLSPGESLGVVGESGSGKSVTMLSLLGLIPETAGKVTGGSALFDGHDLITMSDKNLRRIRGNEIAMIFQDPMTSLNPVLKVGRQISEPLMKHKGLSHRQARARAVELIDAVGIPRAANRVDDYPHEFSGGMRQRVMIAMALSCSPRLLIADEPTTALDVTVQAQILELIDGLRRDLGMALIMVTHDLGVIAGIADRVNVMYAGEIVETGTASAVFADPRHPYTLGLLKSVPRVDQGTDELHSIPGRPPALDAKPAGCRFRPRCTFANPRAEHSRPVLEQVDEGAAGHKAACWLDVRDGSERDGEYSDA